MAEQLHSMGLAADRLGMELEAQAGIMFMGNGHDFPGIASGDDFQRGVRIFPENQRMISGGQEGGGDSLE